MSQGCKSKRTQDIILSSQAREWNGKLWITSQSRSREVPRELVESKEPQKPNAYTNGESMEHHEFFVSPGVTEIEKDTLK